MRRLLALATGLALLMQCAVGQDNKQYKSWNPAGTPGILEGQEWPGDTSVAYGRFPSSAQPSLRKEVWELSKNSAGLNLRFQTNADEVVVRYVVSGGLQFPHMPATGVSGVDLYSKTIDGKWLWAAGKYAFGDTISYRFSSLPAADQHVGNREYTLYLPLYNTVKWMEIKVPEESFFKPLIPRVDLPVVVYGTSIAQGGCAGRPGLAWTNILSRLLERPVINLGFSGNGQMEHAVFEMMSQVNAKIYVIDCLPNMVAETFTKDEIAKRMVDGISVLQTRRPGVPILFCDHDGYTDEALVDAKRKNYQTANIFMKAVFDSLVSAGVRNIHRLSKEAIGQDIETTVDGVHPNDIGMMRYADAYESSIRQILKEAKGNISTTVPVTQRRDFNTYDWEQRHSDVLAFNRAHHPEIVFLGNSITHFWGGLPQGPKDAGIESWNKHFGKTNIINGGYGWDRIENVLLRVYHGELDSIPVKKIVLMIGTNNFPVNTNEEIVAGLRFLVKAIRERQPQVRILVMGIFPRRSMEDRVVAINKMIRNSVLGANISFADAGNLFLQKDKKINERLFSDGLHPNAAGYERLGGFIEAELGKMK